MSRPYILYEADGPEQREAELDEQRERSRDGINIAAQLADEHEPALTPIACVALGHLIEDGYCERCGVPEVDSSLLPALLRPQA